MEKLTVSEVTGLLRAEGIPDSLLTVLAGIYICHTSCAHVIVEQLSIHLSIMCDQLCNTISSQQAPT